MLGFLMATLSILTVMITVKLLAHVVVDPQAWADYAEATIGPEAVDAKVDRWRDEYLAAKAKPNYQTRARRQME